MKIRIDQQKTSIITISLMTAACLLGDSMLYIVLPVHWQDAGLTSLWEVGVLLSINRFIRIPLNPVVGWLYSKISIRAGMLFAGALATFTTLSYSIAQGFLFWLILRCIWGVAFTFLRLGAYFTIVEISTEANRGHYMGMYNGLYRLGSLGGMLFGGFLADQYGTAMPALLFGILTCLAVPVSYFRIPVQARNNRQEQPKPSFRNIASILNINLFWPLFTALSVAMIYQGVLMSTLSFLIQTHYSSAISFMGITIGAASLAGVLQAMRWGWEPWMAPWFGRLSDGRLGRQRLLIVSMLCGAVFFALIPSQTPLWLWLLLIGGILLTATALTTIVDAIACDVGACSSPKVFMTAHSLSIDTGSAAGPLLAFAISDSFGPYAIYWVVFGILSVLSVKWYFQPTYCNTLPSAKGL